MQSGSGDSRKLLSSTDSKGERQRWGSLADSWSRGQGYPTEAVGTERGDDCQDGGKQSRLRNKSSDLPL